MNNFVLALTCVLFVLVAACGSEDGAKDQSPETGNEQNEKYVNEKFSFEVTYPSDVLIGQGEAKNGYGQIFDSESKDAKLHTHAKFNTRDVTLNDAYELAQKGEVREKNIDESKSVFTVSGVDSGKEYAVKTYLLDDVYIIYNFTYPEDKKDIYGPLNKKMIESFVAF